MVAITTLTPFPYHLFAVAITFGGVVSLVILAAGRISGAHINPAVSLAQILTGKLNRELILPYLIFQLIGGVTAGLILRTVLPATADSRYLGSTTLALGIDPLTGFALEIAGTFTLAYVVLRVSSSLPLKYQAAVIGGTLFTLILVRSRSRLESREKHRSSSSLWSS